MKNKLRLLLFLIPFALQQSSSMALPVGGGGAQQVPLPDFNGPMTRTQLENYLKRSITMAGLVDEISCYYPPCNIGTTTYNPQAFNINIKMLANINAKFIGRSCGLWGNEYIINGGYFNNVGIMVNSINAAYSVSQIKPIIQAGIFEFVTPDLNGVMMSDEVANTYGVVKRNFRQADMLYIGGDQTTPDMSRIETQMWFYFLATQYIDKGIEALHMGQIEIMDNNDPNHQYWSDLLTKIRNYAKTRNRHIVLLDAHTFGQYVGNSDQLLFDFHSSPIRMQEELPKWSSTATNGGPAILERNDNCGTPYGRMKGGRTYFGWYATTLPYLVEFDNYPVGNTNTFGDCWHPWGWDEITWFALQSETYRNQWLAYAYYKVKCLDENASLEMPGRRGFFDANVPYPGSFYRAANGFYNQEACIQNLWNDVYQITPTWVHHNFTNESVYNQPATPEVKSSLIFVGVDKMYYIGIDGYIHGYIKDNGATGVWRTVSPSYASQLPAGSQTKAASDLVASPDGTKLIYIGIDGYVHGFDINTVWSYTYFDFVKSEMIQQNLKAIGNLIFPQNDRAYYIANETINGTRKVHGFNKVNGIWTTIGPAYSGFVPADQQQQPAGALTYAPSSDRLYYVGMDGFLYYYKSVNSWQYTYNEVPKTSLLNQTLRINPSKIAVWQNRIYYIGKELGTGEFRIHVLIDDNGTWITGSPTYSASGYSGQPVNTQVQASQTSEIAISPDGTYLAYTGNNGKVNYYKGINGEWSFNKPVGTPSSIIGLNSLQFTDNNKLFFNSYTYSPDPTFMLGDQKVHYYNLQQSFCENPSIKPIEPNYVVQKRDLRDEDNQNENNQYANIDQSKTNSLEQNNLLFQDIVIYPNPAKDEMTISFPSTYLNNEFHYKIVSLLGSTLKEGSLKKETKIKLDGISSGLYILAIFDQNGKLILNKKITINGG